MAIAAGERFGRYEIQAPLGAGGMGEVYAAMDTALRRRVAIKRLLGPTTQSAELRRRALNEARAAAKLNHPGIAAVYDVLDADDAALIVMEYVEGQTLAQRLEQGRPSSDESVRIVAAVADALDAAHRAGVIHRDLKPSNIVLTPDGGVKILDFGLARIATLHAERPGELTSTTTGFGQLAGTPAYMPPERVLGRAVDHRGDIYSLGVVFFELLTGRLPFAAPDFIGLLTQIATQSAPAPHQIDPRIPSRLSGIAKRAMAENPDERYSSAASLRDDLLAVATRPPQEQSPGVAPPPRRSWRWSAMVLTLGVLLAAAAGAFVAWRFSQRAPSPASSAAPVTVAVLPLANHTGDRANDHLGVGIGDVVAAGLFRMPGVNVAACSVVADCPEADRDPRKAAERLGAAMLVNGSLERTDGEVRATLELRDVDSDTVVWTQQYPSSPARLSEIQPRMVKEISSALGRAGAAIQGPPQGDSDRTALATSNVLAFEQYSQARLLLERPDIPGHAGRAVELLRSAVEKDPDFALAHAALGQAYWLRYEETRDRTWTEQATRSILDALRLDSSLPQVRLSLARMYSGVGDLEKAAAEARRAIAAQPQSDEAHRVLASILIEQGRVEQALSEVQLALQLRPRFWRNHNQLGYIHYRAGRFEEAADAYKQSIELQPDNARAYHMLGSTLLAMGKTDAAIAPMARGNEIQPDAVSISNLGTIHYWAGRYDAAVAAYRQAVALKPKEPLYHRNLGDALLRTGARREAMDSYARAVRLTEDLLTVSEGDVNTRAMLAVYLAKLGNHRRAAKEIARAMQANRESEEVWYRKAVVHALAGESAAALDALEEAIRRGASRPAAAQDEDLAALKKDPRFSKLVG